MEWLSSTARSAAQRVEQETAGVTSKRERVKVVGALLASKVAGSVAGAHDHLTQHVHETRQQASATPSSPCTKATHSLHIEVLSAADLHEHAEVRFLATCDAYCECAVGQSGRSWEEKCSLGKVATRVIPRQRNPRWASRLDLPVSDASLQTELTVRVMDAKTLRSDQPLGEICIDLLSEAEGCGSRMLKGGGLATISLRWALRPHSCEEVDLPSGSPSFQQAREHCKRFVEGGDNAQQSASQEFAALVRKMEGEELNELIMLAPLSCLVPGSTSQELLFRALVCALPHLSVSAAARLAGVLVSSTQAGGDASALSTGEQHFLSDLVRNLHGSDLCEFKRLLGTAGCGIDLLNLVDRALTDASLQVALLAHFCREAELCCQRPLHVLCDVDMTFWVGSFGCGGPKFPPGPVPGVRPLLRALGGQLTFLTARPRVCEAQTRRELLKTGVSEAGILAGDMGAVLQAAFLGKEGHAALGERKAQSFVAFRALHPEGRFILFGDSGEGDIDFARGCFMSGEVDTDASALPTRVALIHDVVDETGVTPRTPSSVRAELLRCGVFVFDSYAGAALRLHELGLLQAEGLRAAVQGCLDEMQALERQDWPSPAVKQQRMAELDLSLGLVDEVLKQAGVETVKRATLQQLDDFIAVPALGETG